MRAFDLTPAELRKAAGAGPGHVVLAVLGAALILVTVATLAGNRVDDRRADLTRITQEAAAARQQSAALAPYRRFATLAREREQAVRTLAAGRTDWSAVLREVSRAVPKGVWLTSMVGTTAPGVSVEGAGGSTGALRSSTPGPALEIAGCTRSQSDVARLIAALRAVPGVTRVALAQSEKGDSAGGAGGAGSGGGDCRQGSDRRPQFAMVVFLAPPTAAATDPAVPAAQGQAR